MLFSLYDFTVAVCLPCRPVMVSLFAKPVPDIVFMYNVLPLITVISATVLVLEPTIYSPTVSGIANILLLLESNSALLSWGLVALCSYLIFDVSSSGDGETVAVSNNMEPVPSSFKTPSMSLTTSSVKISASRYSKYALRKASNIGDSSFKYSGSNEGSL